MRYVFVQQIQDYTHYQLAYLKASFPRALFTLLGDLLQAIFTKEHSRTHIKQTSKLFDPELTRVVQYTQSYRSTLQDTDFTKALLLSGQLIVAFNRQGHLPLLIVRPHTAGYNTALQAQLLVLHEAKQTTADIAKTYTAATAIYAKILAAGLKVTLLKSTNQRLAAGVLVVPSFLAKGYTFDAVVLWQVNALNYHTTHTRTLLYTVHSRAHTRHTMLASPDDTPLLDKVPTTL